VKAEALLLSSLPGHQGAVYALENGSESGTLFSAGADKVITAWNLRTRQNLPFLARLPDPVYSLCFVREHNLLLAGTSTGNIHIIDLDKKKEIKILKNHAGQVFDIRYALKQKSFYSLGGDGTFAWCDMDLLSVKKVLKLSDSKLRQMDLNSSETEMAIASGDGDILILDAFTAELKARFKAHTLSANTVKYHPSGKILLSGGKDAHLNIWDLENGNIRLHSIPAHNFSIYSICFSPDNRLFATASRDKTLKIWDAASFEFLLRISKEMHNGHVNSVNTLYWSADPACLVSAGDDRSLILWTVKT
jgi:WD repeat-containing protein 61